jgi:uncharacterized Tic20 family protein
VRQRLIDAADRRVAAAAHLSIGFGVFVGVGFLAGLAINLVIWLRSRRSSFVEFHSEQAGTYQLIVFVLNILLLLGWFGGLIAMPSASDYGGRLLQMGGWVALLLGIGLWYVGTIVLGIYAGLKIALGGDFSSRVFGWRFRRRLASRAAKRSTRQITQ